jgi:archaetidylinositol phosphate synthase
MRAKILPVSSLNRLRSGSRLHPGDGRGVKTKAYGQASLSLVAKPEPEAAPASGSATDPGFKSAVRVQTSLMAPLERRALAWLAGRTPAWISPDHLTLLGLSAMAMAGVSYAAARWWAPFLLVVNLWIAINWLGDSLDGTLARVRNKQRPRYGFYVDHVVDAFGSLFLMCGLALSGYMTPMVAIALLVAFSLLSINLYLATYTIGTFRLSHYKFSPTEMRIILALGNTVAMLKPTVQVLGQPHLLLDVAAVTAIVLMMALLVVSVVQNTVYLYRAERV